jgi:hypothetical protein
MQLSKGQISIMEFRAERLALLPLVSGAGIFLLLAVDVHKLSWNI